MLCYRNFSAQIEWKIGIEIYANFLISYIYCVYLYTYVCVGLYYTLFVTLYLTLYFMLWVYYGF